MMTVATVLMIEPYRLFQEAANHSKKIGLADSRNNWRCQENTTGALWNGNSIVEEKLKKPGEKQAQ